MLINSPEIRCLEPYELIVSNQILEMLRKTYSIGGGRFFIYHNLNYSVYLKTALQNTNDFWIYYLWDPRTEQLMGFAILREYKGCLFLNQIVIGYDFRGRNLSAYLLSGILDSLTSRFGKHAFNVFKLETFLNNAIARNIYDRWGMTASGGKNWYDANQLITKTSREITESNFKLSRDAFGFLQLYSNDECIGTIINSQRVRLNLDDIDKASSTVTLLLKNFKLKDICLVSEQLLPLPLMDTSITYSKSLQDLRHVLKNAKKPI
ncbi:MAG: GNAT family N-acetyltransferase [Flavobacterium sp.]|nr:MAG: GNAT family N-acetyltransferase [Flavobacterium sp.]